MARGTCECLCRPAHSVEVTHRPRVWLIRSHPAADANTLPLAQKASSSACSRHAIARREGRSRIGPSDTQAERLVVALRPTRRGALTYTVVEIVRGEESPPGARRATEKPLLR